MEVHQSRTILCWHPVKSSKGKMKPQGGGAEMVLTETFPCSPQPSTLPQFSWCRSPMHQQHGNCTTSSSAGLLSRGRALLIFIQFQCNPGQTPSVATTARGTAPPWHQQKLYQTMVLSSPSNACQRRGALLSTDNSQAGRTS